MCGIVGYVGERTCQGLLLRGLERLEYRGYDSAGLSLLAEGRIESVRAVGNLKFLKDAVEAASTNGGGVATVETLATTGIGHTRWATHGRVTKANAHPHYDNEDRVHIVLNGIVENFAQLREETSSKPYAAPTPSCVATTRSSRCTRTSPRSSSERARSARS
jgi:glucosamine--fructose-6-phosphate aminotransferase (isomerizing)